MTPDTLEGTPVELDAEGFFRKPEQWTPDMADEIATENGIPELTDRHWQVVDYMRTTYLETEGPGQARGQDRRDPQAPRLHLEENRP